MAWSESTERTPYVHGCRTYVRAPQPIHFPSEEPWEEKVGETKRHLEARTVLYLLLKDAFASAAVGSDQFVYWDARDPRRCLSPDVFLKLGARDDMFDTWKVWERSAPDLAVEIVSPSDRRDLDWDDKFARYQASGIREVVRFDPANGRQPLRVWDRIEGDLTERDPASDHLRECVTLGLWWVVAPSEHGPLLRPARDREGTQLLSTPSEERVRLAAELAEERKARAAAEHDRLLAEQRLREERDARAQEQSAAAAEIERLKAELARARGEQR